MLELARKKTPAARHQKLEQKRKKTQGAQGQFCKRSSSLKISTKIISVECGSWWLWAPPIFYFYIFSIHLVCTKQANLYTSLHFRSHHFFSLVLHVYQESLNQVLLRKELHNLPKLKELDNTQVSSLINIYFVITL